MILDIIDYLDGYKLVKSFILAKIQAGFLKKEPDAKFHPHTIGLWAKNNTLYLASNKLDVFGIDDYYGFGKFNASDRTNLSIDPSKKSIWKCPKWLNPKHGGSGMTYHKDLKRWSDDSVDIVGRGQEFITVPKKKINDCKKWLKNIFKDAKNIDEIKSPKNLLNR